jgi:hypothetical protein
MLNWPRRCYRRFGPAEIAIALGSGKRDELVSCQVFVFPVLPILLFKHEFQSDDEITDETTLVFRLHRLVSDCAGALYLLESRLVTVMVRGYSTMHLRGSGIRIVPGSDAWVRDCK